MWQSFCVWGICTGNHREKLWFTMIVFIRLRYVQYAYEHTCVHIEDFQSAFLLKGVYYFLLLLSNGSMSKILQTTLIFFTTCWSLFHPNTGTVVLLIVMSLWISLICTEVWTFQEHNNQAIIDNGWNISLIIHKSPTPFVCVCVSSATWLLEATKVTD